LEIVTACYNPSPAGAARAMSILLTGEEQAALARGIRDGDPAAEEAFAKLFGERLRVMMRVRIGDAETARELAQDALVAAWFGIRDGRLRQPDRLAAFVHGTAQNIVNNYIRARAGHPAAEPLGEAVERLPAPSAQVEAERRTLVAAALRRLSADDRQVLLMTLVAGLQPREIAKTLGLSVDVVRARKSRALRRAIDAVRELSRTAKEGH
jgi:RNA polymerase sigma-70 factor (ECF subfamily)